MNHRYTRVTAAEKFFFLSAAFGRKTLLYVALRSRSPSVFCAATWCAQVSRFFRCHEFFTNYFLLSAPGVLGAFGFDLAAHNFSQTAHTIFLVLLLVSVGARRLFNLCRFILPGLVFKYFFSRSAVVRFSIHWAEFCVLLLIDVAELVWNEKKRPIFAVAWHNVTFAVVAANVNATPRQVNSVDDF